MGKGGGHFQSKNLCCIFGCIFSVFWCISQILHLLFLRYWLTEWSSTKRSSAPASPRGSWYRGQGTIHRAFIPPAIYPPFIYPPLPSPLIPHPYNHHTMVFWNQVYQEFIKKLILQIEKYPFISIGHEKRSCVHLDLVVQQHDLFSYCYLDFFADQW